MHHLSRLDRLIYALRVGSIKTYCASSGKTVMDVGCGYQAQFLRYIQKKYTPKKAIAYDLVLDHDLLEKQGIICIEGDLNKPLHLEDPVDMIFATAILEHLEQPIFFLQECYRVLAPGGMLLLTTPSVRSQPVLELLAYRLHIISEEEIRDHKEYYDKAKLQEYFHQAGFRADRLMHRYFELWMNNLVVAYK